MFFFSAIIITIACIVFNRLAGGGFWFGELFDSARPNKLPGRALYPAALGVALVSMLIHEWTVALSFGVAFLIWRSFAWGRWFDLHRLPDGHAREGKKLKPMEVVITKLSFGSDHVAMFWRHNLIILGLIPVAFVSGQWWLLALCVPFALFAVMAYEAGWRITKEGTSGNPIGVAEMLVGILWAAIILLAA